MAEVAFPSNAAIPLADAVALIGSEVETERLVREGRLRTLDDGAQSAIALGAVPYNDASKPERYSSRGPVTHYFGPVAGTTPATAFSSPQVIAKPDVVATDCGATTFFAFLQAGVWRFCGRGTRWPRSSRSAPA